MSKTAEELAVSVDADPCPVVAIAPKSKPRLWFEMLVNFRISRCSFEFLWSLKELEITSRTKWDRKIFFVCVPTQWKPTGRGDSEFWTYVFLYDAGAAWPAPPALLWINPTPATPAAKNWRSVRWSFGHSYISSQLDSVFFLSGDQFQHVSSPSSLAESAGIASLCCGFSCVTNCVEKVKRGER